MLHKTLLLILFSIISLTGCSREDTETPYVMSLEDANLITSTHCKEIAKSIFSYNEEGYHSRYVVWIGDNYKSIENIAELKNVVPKELCPLELKTLFEEKFNKTINSEVSYNKDFIILNGNLIPKQDIVFISNIDIYWDFSIDSLGLEYKTYKFTVKSLYAGRQTLFFRDLVAAKAAKLTLQNADYNFSGRVVTQKDMD